MTIRTMFPAAARMALLGVCAAVCAFAGGPGIAEKLRLLRERADWEERNALLRVARSDAKGTERAALRGANSGEHSQDAQESRIIELPSLPTPDVTSVRRTLGLDQAASNRDAPKALAVIRAAGETPAAGDLAESDVVRLTPEIRNLARELGSPQRMFAFVRDHIEYSLYFGAKQNSLAVLLSRRANNVDTATLLIALLRASGVPARYAHGTVVANFDDVAAWVGARKPAALQGMTGLPLVATIRESEVEFYHVWVEVWLETTGGAKWVSLDASFKTLDYEPGIEIPVQPFDQDVFLSTQRRELASDLYVDSVRSYLNKTFPGWGLSDVIYRGRLAATGETIEAPPYRIVQAKESRSEMDDLRHRIVVSLIRPADSRVLWQLDSSVPRICLQSLTVTSAGSEPFRPQLMLDDAVAATTTESFAANASLTFRVDYYFPGMAQPQRTVSHTYRVGSVFAFGYNVAQVSEGSLHYRIDRLLSSPGGLAADPVRTTRELVHIAALRYLHRVESEARRLFELHHWDYLPWYLDSAATMAFLPGQPSADRPFLITPSRLVLDAQGSLVGAYVSRNTGTIPSAEFLGVVQALSPTLSGLEHEIWEEIAVSPTASTVKVLQVAADRKIPILRINAGNVATEGARLPTAIPQNVRDNILATARAGGNTVIIPSQIVDYFRWRGYVYTVRTATGGVAGWFVGLLNGGDTGGNTQEPGPGKPGSTGNPLPQNGETTGDPVDVSNGNMFYQAEDVRLAAAGLPFQLVRTYNSQVSEAGPFGIGWTHSYNMSLRLQGASLLYRNATGGVEPLTAQGSEWVGYRGLRVAREGTGWRLRFRQGLELRFDSSGKLSSATDSNGNRQALIYDGRGNLASITDPAGRAITFSYNTQNRVTAIADFAGRQNTYSYDAAGDLAEARVEAGAVTRYTYYSESFNNHNMKSVTDPEGNTTTWVYYADDRVAQVSGPGGGVMYFFFLPFRNETVVVDERGNSRTYQYDSAGRITRLTDPLGNTATRRYTPEGLIAEQTDFAGATTRLSWDALGNLTRIVDPLGNTTEATYDPVYSRTTHARDAKGNITRFEYDTRGNLTKSVDATGAERRFAHDSRGYTTSFTDPEGNAWSFAYNDAGRRTEWTDPNRSTARLEYDAAIRPIALVDPLGARTQLEYDARDLITRVSDPLGSESVLAYDRAGRAVRVTDANRQTQQFTYDGSSNLAQITTADAHTVDYGNGPADCRCSSLAGMMSSVKNSKGAQSAYSYDPRGFVSEKRNAMGDGIRYRRDANGNLAEIAYDDGVTIRFRYDALNRLTSRIYPDNTQDTFTHDAVGNLLTASNAQVTYTYAYDANNRVISVRDSRFPEPIRYAYDSVGRRQRMTHPDGTATVWTYRRDGALASIQSAAGQLIEFAYDAAGRRQKAAFPNQTEAAYTYDAAGRLLSIVYTNTATGAELNRFVYTHDAAGNRTSMTDTAGTHSYKYDINYRLTGATHPDQPAEQYAYDDAGNRGSSHREPAYVYDAADRLTNTSAGQFAYDRRGNLITRPTAAGATRYSYDVWNRLERVEADGGLRVTFKYDPFGRRIEKILGPSVTRYLYDFENVLAEYDGGGHLLARHTFGPRIDEPMLMERDLNGNAAFENDEAFFYQSDGLGSIRALANRNADIVERYRYDAFGNLAEGPGASTVGNPYFFTGREWDSETGLYHYRARSYEPALGRFLQSDTLWSPLRPVTLNRYVYVGNNPVSFVDPTGHEIQTPIDGDSRANLAQKTLQQRLNGTYIPEGGIPYGWSDENQKGWHVDWLYGGWVRVQNPIIAYTQVRDSEGRVHIIEQYWVDSKNPDSYLVRLPSEPPGSNWSTDVEQAWNFAGSLAESAWKASQNGIRSFWNFGLSSNLDSDYGSLW